MKRLLLLALIFICVGCVSKTRNNAQSENVDSLTVEELIERSIKKTFDSMAKARDYYRQNLGHILPEWWQYLEENMSKKSSDAPMESVRIMYSCFEHSATATAWSKRLREQGYDMSDAAIKEDAVYDMERIKKQLEYFPTLRLLFAQACKEEYWIDDIDVKISGNRNQYIHFVGSEFSVNRNIKAFHDDIGLTFDVLRFAQVRYSWYDGGKYTYFNIYDGKDNYPIPTILEGVYWWGAFPNTF